MRYGHFDDAAREYVITRPDTPRSWSNYLQRLIQRDCEQREVATH